MATTLMAIPAELVQNNVPNALHIPYAQSAILISSCLTKGVLINARLKLMQTDIPNIIIHRNQPVSLVTHLVSIVTPLQQIALPAIQTPTYKTTPVELVALALFTLMEPLANA